MSRLDEFRVFVKKYPLLKEEVINNKRTWQSIYEEWVLYGDDSSNWGKYKEDVVENNTTPIKEGLSSIKDVFTNIKKIDPNKVNNTLNSVQKVLQIAQSVTGSKTINNIPSGFNDWWD